MKKILLIFEDFQESSRAQVDLKKVGFDVLALNTLTRLSDHVLSFRPDAVIGFGTHKFSSIVIGQKLKEVSHFKGKSILILPTGERPTPSELSKAKVDALTEAPTPSERLIELIAKVLVLDSASLLGKFSKSKIQEHAAPPVPRSSKFVEDKKEESFTVKAKNPPASSAYLLKIEDPDRTEKYQKFVHNMQIDTHQTTHDRLVIRDRLKELKKGWDFNLLDEIDKLKRQFTEALFKKNK